MNMDLYGKFVDEGKKIGPSALNTPKKVHYDEITLTVELAANDELLMALIPEGSRIIDAYILGENLGSQGKLDMGLKEYVDREGNTIAEDQDSLVFDADLGGQAALQRASLQSIALGKVVGKGGARPFLKCTEASDAGIGQTIKAVVIYCNE